MHHRVRYEPQSKYHSQLEDVNNVDEEQKGRLFKAFEEAGLPPSIVEAHAFLSSDLTHDNAFAQHVNDRISGQQHNHEIRMDWSFSCSCHGKSECDGEGGTIKNAADAFECRGGDLQGVLVWSPSWKGQKRLRPGVDMAPASVE
eukprot:6213129-Pleurochrysis_carterae.AAC.1